MNNALRLLLVLLSLVAASKATPQSASAITYQGQLELAGAPANGVFDFEFALYPTAGSDTEAAAPLQVPDVDVQDGIVTIPLDFGAAVFSADTLWLEIRVRDGASDGDYTVLAPRQPVTAAPVALHARNVAAGAIGSEAIADESVGATEVVAGEVQLRISGACGAGFALQAINENGTVVCTPIESGGGDITGVIAGAGLTGGSDSGDASLAVDFVAVQARLASACGENQALNAIDENGNPTCVPVAPLEGAWAVALEAQPPTSIAVGPNGRPVIAYRRGSGVNIAACNDPYCRDGDETISTLDGSGNYPALAIGGDDLPVVAFSRSSGIWVAHCNDVACSGGDETITEVVAGTGTTLPAIAIGNDGYPVIAFNSGSEIWAVKCNDPACTGGDEAINPQVTAAAASAFGRVGIAVGANGFPLIFFWNTSADQIKLIVCNDVACQGQDETERPLDGGSGADALSGERLITLTATDNPVVGKSGGRIYRCLDNACVGVNLVPGAFLQEEVSAARGPDGHPAFAHSEGSAVLYSRCPDPECTERVSAAPLLFRGSSISGTSLAFGSDGSPVVSFVESFGVLRVYRCARASCL